MLLTFSCHTFQNSYLLFALLLSFLSFEFTLCTISPGDKAKQKRSKALSGPQDQSVFDLELISEEPRGKDIVAYSNAYYKDTSLRHFNGTVLGYVTPWNSHGYDVAKIFAKKFDIISPVWLQVLPQENHYILAGTHDIDSGWLQDVRRKGKIQNRTVKVFPRIIFDHFNDRDIKVLMTNEAERSKVNALLISSCKTFGFDGIVLEVWSQLAGRMDDKFLYSLVLQMVKDLQKKQLPLILVIPPYRKDMPLLFGEKHLDRLYKHVYAFSLMTYDYSSVERPGANAPLYWVRQSIEALAPQGCHDMIPKRAKILMGLNMYGNDYTPDGGGPITFGRYLELVQIVKRHLTYDERDVENFFEVKTATGRHIVFYPSLHSINERLKLATELGVGVSIWELGQGLDYFYDLF